jgi:hypothetical protein
VQLRLIGLDPPTPEARVWETLEDQHRAVVLDVLVRVLLKATLAPPLEDLPDE